MGDDDPAHPTSHYGVYKQANEGSALVYWRETGLRSVGVRPFVVFGPGRDQGLTSAPTKAVAAAVLGRTFEIGFSGRTVFQYTADLGATLVAAARSGLDGARVFNLGGTRQRRSTRWSRRSRRRFPGRGVSSGSAAPALPFPEVIQATGIAELGPLPVTPLAQAVAETARAVRSAPRRGRARPRRARSPGRVGPSRGGAIRRLGFEVAGQVEDELGRLARRCLVDERALRRSR